MENNKDKAEDFYLLSLNTKVSNYWLIT